MKKITDTLQMFGILLCTGVGAIIGFVGGALAFYPNCTVTVSSNKSNEST